MRIKEKETRLNLHVHEDEDDDDDDDDDDGGGDRQCTCNVTLRRVRELVVPWKRSITYLSVCARACVRAYGCVGVCMRRSTCGLDNPACNAYASYCDVICDPLVSTIFFRIINDAIFGEKKCSTI